MKKKGSADAENVMLSVYYNVFACLFLGGCHQCLKKKPEVNPCNHVNCSCSCCSSSVSQQRETDVLLAMVVEAHPLNLVALLQGISKLVHGLVG